jgi:hypothetical protein
MGSPTLPSEKYLGSFGSEFVTALNTALANHKTLAINDIQEHVEIVEFNYNEFFDKLRKEMQKNAEMTSRLQAVEALAGGSFAEGLVGKLLAWEEDFGKDKFFYTHWLDVIFYTTFIGGKVRVDLAKKLNDLVGKHGNENVHIVAHSLGTALLYDTLNLMYRPEHDPQDEIPDLSPENDRLKSIWMVANVSRLVNAVARLGDPLSPTTTVKPGDGGCTTHFYNIRHKLDPFTYPAQFDPDNDGDWISTTDYTIRYRSIETKLVTDPNTHSFGQYIEDPLVSSRLLKTLLRKKYKPSETQKSNAEAAYAEKSIQGAFNRIKASLANIDISDSGSIDELLVAAKALKAAIESIEAQLGGGE